MSNKRSDSATGVGCESEEWGAGCCSPFENRNVPSCIQPGSPRESSDSTMVREAVCLLRGQSKLGKGEFVFQA